MKIINPGYEILTPINGVDILKHIEECGHTKPICRQAMLGGV